MKKILFVDDERAILDGLRLALRKHRATWEMDFAVGPEEALGRVATKDYDVVVTDVQMPTMDGPTLLGRIKESHPSTTRIILSGHANADAALRSLSVSHQFLAKPCDPQALVAVIERTCKLQELLRDERLRELVGKLDRLPSPSKVYQEMSAAMCEREPSIKRIAEIVEGDPGMTTKVLQLVNSSYFGLAQRVVSVERALVYLGLEVVRSIALTQRLFSAAEGGIVVPGYELDRAQVRSLLAARIAKRLAGEGQSREEAFTSALLLDVGEVVLVTVVPEILRELTCAEEGSEAFSYVKERDALGVSHAEVGAYLLGLWGLPPAIVEAVAYHHEPGAVASHKADALTVGHFAAGAVHAAAANRPISEMPIDRDYLDVVGVDAAQIEEWSAIASEEVRRWRERMNA